MEVSIPSKLHNSLIGSKGRFVRSIMEECGGVHIHFPTEGSGNDKVTIRGPVEEVAKAKQQLLALAEEKVCGILELLFFWLFFPPLLYNPQKFFFHSKQRISLLNCKQSLNTTSFSSEKVAETSAKFVIALERGSFSLLRMTKTRN